MEASRGNVPVVGECLGHRPPYKMTMRYLHALEDAKRRAIRGLDRPGFGPQKAGGGRKRA